MAMIQSLWENLENWYTENTGHSLNLCEGASEEEISKAEKKMNITFPPDFREHLLLHNGQEADTIAQWMPGCSPLLSLERIVAQWTSEQEWVDEAILQERTTSLNDRVYYINFHPKRIPIAGNEYCDGDNSYLDLHPGPAGKEGQLITFVTECDLVLLGNGFKHALERYLEALQKGALIWHKEEESKEEFIMMKGKKLLYSSNQANNFALIN